MRFETMPCARRCPVRSTRVDAGRLGMGVTEAVTDRIERIGRGQTDHDRPGVAPESYREWCQLGTPKKEGRNMPSTYRIVCVTTQHPHRHIISVGVGETAASPGQTMTTATVRSKIDAGDAFETYSPSTSKTAKVEKDTCNISGCTVATIRSTPDAVTDNNLDNLAVCP